MALKGTLKDFGIADILQLIGHQLKTGTLKLTAKNQEVRISFVKGNVIKAESSTRDRQDLLGSLMVRAEILTQDQLDTALEIQKRTLKRLGDILVDSGYVSNEVIREFTRLQSTETIYKLFLWKTGNYEFEQQEIDLDPESYEPIRSESVLMEGFRMVDEWPFIRKRITSYAMRFEVVRALPEEKQKDKGGDEEDFLAGIDEAFASMEDGEEPEDERDNIGDNERTVFGLVNPERDVQKLIDLSLLGEFETCKALLNLLNGGVLAAIPPKKGEEASATIEGGALAAVKTPSRVLRVVPALVRVGMHAVLIVLALVVLRLSGFDPRDLWRSNSLQVDQSPIEESIGLRSQDRIENALQIYRLETGRFPNHLQQLVEAGLLRSNDVRYPWREPYEYQRHGAGYQLRRPFR